MKRCFRCLETKPLDAFYKHAAMGDGRLGKCKECTKADVLAHRQSNLESIRAYDRFRGGLTHRVAARKEYGQTEAGKLAHARALKKSRATFPNKAIARNAVSNAVRDGRLVKTACEVCGAEKVEGHHADYDNLLGVTWLCNLHHRAAHALLKTL